MSHRRPAPNSLRHAMELCLKHAQSKHRRSVDRVADLMGLTSKWTLYKWLENGRIPGILIRPFEHACGATYITEYMAHSAHRLAVEIPSGRPGETSDIAELQEVFAKATRLLIRFYRDNVDPDDTVSALYELLTAVAWHRENVNKSAAPELDLFTGEVGDD